MKIKLLRSGGLDGGEFPDD